VQEPPRTEGVSREQLDSVANLQTELDESPIAARRIHPVPPDNELYRVVERQLQRPPLGEFEVCRYSSGGVPQVLRVSPILQASPFPTLYWLTDPTLIAEIGRIESSGWIKRLEKDVIPNNRELQTRMIQDNIRYIKERWSYLPHTDSAPSAAIARVLRHRGIGGIIDFTRVRCLHMQYAYHLMSDNGTAIGQLIDREFHVDRLV